MTTVLIVDPNEETRLALEAQLAESNQFKRVMSCADLHAASRFLADKEITVILLDAQQAAQSALLPQIKEANPELGVVLVRGAGGVLDSATLQSLGGHAQASRLAAPMEIIASVAKALVVRLKPGSRILGKLLKDGTSKS
jgi:DNA-binding NtrC family response regulator